MASAKFQAVLFCVIIAQASLTFVEAKGGRGGGGGRSSSSRSSSSYSSSRSSSSYSSPSRTTSSSYSSPSRTTSSSSYGWRSPSSNYGWTSPTSPTLKASTSNTNRNTGASATAGYGWNVPTATARPAIIPSAPAPPPMHSSGPSGTYTPPGSRPPYSNTNAGFTNPNPYGTTNNGYTNPYGSTNTGYTNPYGNTGYTSPYGNMGSGYNPMYPQNVGGNFGYNNKPHSNTMQRVGDAGIGFLAGTALSRGSGSRFSTYTHYRGNNWSRESGERTGTRRVVTLASSQSGTCTALRTNQNRTLGANDTVTVTLYRHENYLGKQKEIQLSPNECLNLHLEEADWNDQVSSIKPFNDTCVMIWEHANCEGRFACVKDGSKGAARLSEIHMNDELTSIQLC